MESISLLTFYAGIASLFLRGYTFEDTEVKFVRYACMYKHHYVPHHYSPKDECKRITCSVQQRTLMIEECAGVDSYNSSCSAGLRGKDLGRFPFCCNSRIRRENQTVIKGYITYYTSEGGPEFSEHVFHVKPTGKWSAPTQYIFGTCKNARNDHKVSAKPTEDTDWYIAPGQFVYVRNYGTGDKWTPGRVKAITGARLLEVETEAGIVRRRMDQVRKSDKELFLESDDTRESALPDNEATTEDAKNASAINAGTKDKE
nr:uncharacterized protein LOC119188279 [Rhipicephalus microplus]